MRVRVYLLSWIGSLCLGACSPQTSSAPAKAPSTPVAPLQDWTLIASHPGEKKSDEALKAETSLATGAIDPRVVPGSKPSAGRRPKAASIKRSKDALSEARREAAERTSRRHGLYTRLAKDSLVVIRLADLSRLPGAFEASELGRLCEQSELQGAALQLRESMNGGLAQLRAQSSEFAAAMDFLPSLGGEVVIAISGLTSESIAAKPNGLAWVVTIVYAAGDQSDRVAEVAAPLLASLAEKHGWSLQEKSEPAWGCEIGDQEFLLDFERRDGLFELRLGGRAAVARELISSRRRAEGNSFYSSRVAADASSVEALGAKPVLEAHLQLTSLWDAMRASGNRADQRVLARTGLTQFYGASLAVGRTEHGLAEALTLHSPAGLDLITHAVSGQPLDLGLARAVPAELANTGLYSFDGTRLIPDLCLLLPSQAQSALVRAIAECRRETGIDIEKEVLGNFGPTIAIGSDGWHAGPDDEGRLPPAFLACQVRDPARAQRTLTAILIASGRSAQARDQLIDGVHVFSLDLSGDEFGAELELNWCIFDSVLLASTQVELLREAMAGLRGHEVANPGMRRALANAGEGCFATGFTRGDSGTPDALMLGRRTDAGLELSSSDGNAMQSTIISMFSVGMVSSIALPTLFKLRLDANERAAKSTLVVVNDAQAMARTHMFLDQDGDGRGECLFLPELCGAEKLRGSSKPLIEPWLDGSFRWVAPGVGAKSGYCYRVDLRTNEGGSSCSALSLGQGRVAIDAAEDEFIAYAWPMEEAASGSAIFVFDSKLGLYSSDNRAEAQHYSADLWPKAGAHCAALELESGATRHVGRDGGIWLRLRGP